MATPSSHRPRKKTKKPFSTIEASADLTVTKPTTDGSPPQPSPAFPLVAFFWSARGSTSQWLVLPLVLIAAGLFRWAVGLWGFSGEQDYPKGGDFEAQRHWMELTAHLPVSAWYFYDLQWWGLDYPPLTAYHSWLLGKVGSFIDASWFALDSSRKAQSPELKMYMRATVIVSEYLIYVPAVVIFLRRYTRASGVTTMASSIALLAILMQPATLIIDHGHFQFNTVMLGFVVASLSSIMAGRLLWACVFFVAALGFKQMALYYSPAMFAFLLGSCISPRINILRLIGIALVTLLSFALLFAPLILGALYDKYRGIPYGIPTPPLLEALPITLDKDSYLYPPVLLLAQSIHRIFPFARGLFEDKVANFWCAAHTFYKLHRFSPQRLQQFSLLLTLAHIIPSSFIIGLHPKRTLLPLALASSSWAFYLFSFQVHEKSVLLPLLPMTLLLGSANGLSFSSRAWIGFANLLGTFTMYPLLKYELLRMPYFIVSLLWVYLLGLPPTSLSIYTSSELNILTKLIHLGGYAAMIVWHIAEAVVIPPSSKPDLWPVLNAVMGAPLFYIIFLWCNWELLRQSGLVDGIFGKKGKPKTA